MGRRRPAVGQLRGRSRPGRLRLWEDALEGLCGDLLDAGAVDLGVGEDPVTVAEWAARLGALTAVEVHPRRAEAARGLSGVSVVQSDAFAPPHGATAGVARCANLLRQYPLEAVPAAHAALAGWVRPGGVVAVGSCDREGHVGSFLLLRRGPGSPGTPAREALVLLTDFARGFAPLQLRDHLPRDLRWSVRPGTRMGDFFASWTAAWEAVRTGDARRDGPASAEAVPHLEARALASGCAFVWRPPGGVPAGAPHR